MQNKIKEFWVTKRQTKVGIEKKELYLPFKFGAAMLPRNNIPKKMKDTPK